MSINNELNKLRNTKKNIRAAILDRGVSVSTEDAFGVYPNKISLISTTSGTYNNTLKQLLEKTATSVTIPSGTSSIKDYCFANFNALASVTIPSTISRIYEYAFAYCPLLTSITIPDSVTRIDNYAFFQTGLTSLDLGNGVKRIGESAFRCPNLTTLVIPESVTYMDYFAFSGCTSLTSITCLSSTPAYLADGVFGSTNNCPIYVPVESVDTYKTAWPNYASRITYKQFAAKFTPTGGGSDIVIECGDLGRAGTLSNNDVKQTIQSGSSGDLTIGGCVTSIAQNAFYLQNYKLNIGSLTISDSVTSIGQEAFEANEITSLDLGEGVTTIGTGAFFGTHINLDETSIVIPASVTSIGDWAFQYNGKNSLAGWYTWWPTYYANIAPSDWRKIYCLATTPPTLIGTENFSIWNGNAPERMQLLKIFVPDEAVDAYRAAWADGVIITEDDIWPMSRDTSSPDWPQEWVEQSYNCEMENGERTGNSISEQQDVNPNSPTYGMWKVITIENDPRCQI